MAGLIPLLWIKSEKSSPPFNLPVLAVTNILPHLILVLHQRSVYLHAQDSKIVD